MNALELIARKFSTGLKSDGSHGDTGTAPLAPPTKKENSGKQFRVCPDQPPTKFPLTIAGPCPTCGEPTAWVDGFDNVRCCGCEPPAAASLVRLRVMVVFGGEFEHEHAAEWQSVAATW